MSRSETLTLAALVAAGVLLCGAPLGLLLRVSVAPEGAFDPGHLLGALEGAAFRRALWNSLDSALFSALAATLAGAGLAAAVALTDIRMKAAAVFLLLLPMMIPPHVTAIAWIKALGPSSPLLAALGIAPPLGSTHPLYSREGVIALLSVQHAPLAFLTVRAALRALPRDLIEAARVSGARPAPALLRVALPLCLPALIAGFALSFVAALGNFGIPALLGVPGRYVTLPVLIWRRLASFGPSALADMAAIAAVVAGLAALAVAAQMAAQTRARVALIGPPQPALAFRLGPWRPAAEALIALVILTVVALPLSALLATALTPALGVPLTAQTLTFEHFHQVLFVQSVTLRAFANSTLTAGGAALLLAVGAAALARFLHGPRGPGRAAARGVAGLAELSFAVPGIALSVAFILAFIRPLPGLGVTLYGTLWIILLAYLAAFFSVALKPVSAAAAQLDPALEDAARVSGARFGMRMRRIHLPLLAPAAASGALLVFLTAYNEITVSALLWSRGTETIGTTIFNYEDGGSAGLAAAMSSITVAATAALMLALNVAAGRLPAGVIPWRA